MPGKKQLKKPSSNKPQYIRNVLPDIPDERDWIYTPSLDLLEYPTRVPPKSPTILDQGSEGACTGFALAAVINQLCAERHRKAIERAEELDDQFTGTPITVSARMLFFLAKQHDEWRGEDYDWSSLKGAILGWRSMGVCEENLWKNSRRNETMVEIDQARNARSQTIGAFYRLKPQIEHFHTALNETGALVVSAKTHRGWNKASSGKIPYKGNEPNEGGHAFAIVGYNEQGFWIQNSWDTRWGKKGLALWSYDDWNDNVMDAWVVQLAYPTPTIFGKEPRSAILRGGMSERADKTKPLRINIVGHFVHIDDGKFHEKGDYFSSKHDTQQTAKLVANSDNYDHLLIYAHGGLNSPTDSARRIFAMKDTFKRNRIYPYHIMYDVGIGETIKDTLNSKFNPFAQRTQGWWNDLADGINDWIGEKYEALKDKPDQLLENLVRKPVTPLWEEMKLDAERAFKNSTSAGTETVRMFWDAFQKATRPNGNPKIHLIGHSTGAIVLAHFLRMTRKRNIGLPISSVSLLAPACTIDLFKDEYLPHAKSNAKGARIDMINIYCMTDELERDDTVEKLYRKSLLYMISNALERVREKPILGMQKFRDKLPAQLPRTTFIYPQGRRPRTNSKSHGGFDNDPTTMNDILKTILGKAPTPSNKFTQESLDY